MKYILRNYISRFSSYTEIYLSVLIITGVVIGSLGLIQELFNIFSHPVNIDVYHDFLGFALALIISVEFVKMLSRHTPGSTIEVLLFALARKLIVTEGSSLELLLGVIAIAILFMIKRFLFSQAKISDGYTLSAATMVSKARKLTGLNLPEGLAHTIGGLVAYIAKQEERDLREGAEYTINGVRMRINRLRDGIIEAVGFLDR